MLVDVSHKGEAIEKLIRKSMPDHLPHQVAARSLQPNESCGQTSLADAGSHETVVAAGCGCGQRASPQMAAGNRLSEAPGLLHQ